MNSDRQIETHLPLNPVTVLYWLRANHILSSPYYLHINRDYTEIGWHATAQINYLNGETTDRDIWIAAIKRMGDQAAADGNKTFGYLGFDAYDRSQGEAPDHSVNFPLASFFIPKHRISFNDKIIQYHGPDPTILDKIKTIDQLPLRLELDPCVSDQEFSEQEFMAAVSHTKKVLSEDIIKVVLSRYRRFEYNADLLALFQRYCLLQKYTDAVLMDFGTIGAAIASPELLVKINDGLIFANPLAGTRMLSNHVEENKKIAKMLLCDRKELAEHTLALLQMIAELRPHCKIETLVVNKLLDIVYQNNLMHLSSELRGQLREDRHCVDAIMALFPSAMVSGVPKAEAIRIIRSLEPFPRGLFAGTVGWLSGRNCHFALIIRGIYKYGRRIFVQAGAGIMAESDPLQENEEVNMKMAVILDTLTGKKNEK